MPVSPLSDSRVRDAAHRHGWADIDVIELAQRVPRKMVYSLVAANIRLEELPYMEDHLLESLRNVGPTVVRQLRESVPFKGTRLRVPCSHCGGTGLEPVTWT